MPKRNVAVTNSSKSQVGRFPTSGNRTYAGNLGAGRTTAEVASIGGSNHRRNTEIDERDPAGPAISSRRNRELLRVESGPCVSHEACGVQQVKAGSFSKN